MTCFGRHSNRYWLPFTVQFLLRHVWLNPSGQAWFLQASTANFPSGRMPQHLWQELIQRHFLTSSGWFFSSSINFFFISSICPSVICRSTDKIGPTGLLDDDMSCWPSIQDWMVAAKRPWRTTASWHGVGRPLIIRSSGEMRELWREKQSMVRSERPAYWARVTKWERNNACSDWVRQASAEMYRQRAVRRVKFKRERRMMLQKRRAWWRIGESSFQEAVDLEREESAQRCGRYRLYKVECFGEWCLFKD